MASSSTSAAAVSCTWIYDVFPSFRGEDVRKSFLSHLLKELESKVIKTFKDHRIQRSRPIAPELLAAIRDSNIAVVIFSENYASSTWCLNELVEIHHCFKDLGQMVIPIFYKVDPSDVRKQTGKFGEGFSKTCEGTTDEELKTKWKKTLAEVASIAGEDSLNWSDEAKMIEQISKNVSNKLCTTTHDDPGDFVGIKAHIEEINSKLCLESGGVRMVGIVGPSGIGKSTIATALYTQLSSQFTYRVFKSYKRTIPDDNSMKLAWEKQFLSDILDIKNIKIDRLGTVKQRLNNKKVLVVLDDVEEIQLLDTLVGQHEWFGHGSRIIVVTQDKALLKSHDIGPPLIYEVPFPSTEVAREMFCRYAFKKNSPPDGFTEFVDEVVKLDDNIPMGLKILGSSLRRSGRKEWEELMPMLQNGLEGKYRKPLNLIYDKLDSREDKDLFLYIACLFNGESVTYIKNLLEEVFTGVQSGLEMLARKSFIRITPDETVQMHNLLQKFGLDIIREESITDPGKRRFLVDLEDIREVLTEKNCKCFLHC